MEESEYSIPLDSKLAPFMLFDCDKPKKTQFFYSISGEKLVARSIDEMNKNSYWITARGWLFMLAPDSRTTFLWTPLNEQKIELPQATEDFPGPDESKCLLSENPTDPNCVVLLLSLDDTVFWFCRPGGNQWFKHQYGNVFQHDDLILHWIWTWTSFINNKFCMDIDNAIVTLEFNPNPTITCTTVEPGAPPNLRGSYMRLVQSCGNLFRVYFCYPVFSRDRITQIAVYKMDFLRKIWEQVDRLGDQAFFFTKTGPEGTSLPACKLGLKKNSIYFTKYGFKGLYVHNMERGTTSVHNPGADLPNDFTAHFLMPVVP